MVEDFSGCTNLFRAGNFNLISSHQNRIPASLLAWPKREQKVKTANNFWTLAASVLLAHSKLALLRQRTAFHSLGSCAKLLCNVRPQKFLEVVPDKLADYFFSIPWTFFWISAIGFVSVCIRFFNYNGMRSDAFYKLNLQHVLASVWIKFADGNYRHTIDGGYSFCLCESDS